MDENGPGKATEKRCGWCGEDPLYIAYHDDEWGVPEHDGRALWEKLVLDGFQAGLAWITILRKREAFRAAFEGFEPAVIAGWGEADVARLLGADYVIGVDIFMPALRPRLGPFSQGLAAIETLVRHAGRGANECDCLIVPHMEGRSYFKFSDYERLIVLGEEAALQQLPAIRQSLERAEAARQRPAAALSIASPEVGSLHGAN